MASDHDVMKILWSADFFLACTVSTVRTSKRKTKTKENKMEKRVEFILFLL